MTFSRAFVSLALIFAAVSQAAAQTTTVEVTDGDLPDSVRERFLALLADEEPADSRFTARRQARRAEEIILNVLNSEGYFAAQTRISVDLEPEIRPRVIVTPGPVFTFSSTDVIFSNALRDPENPDFGLQLSPGDAARAGAIIAEERRLLAALRTGGYPEARTLKRELVGDRDAGTLALTYRFETGPHICLGDLKLTQEGRTRPNMISRLSDFGPGQQHDQAALDTLENRLIETRMFNLASVDIAETPSKEHGNCQTRDVLVTLEDAPPRTLGLGASYSTSEGAGFEADWTRRNVTGRLDTLNLNLLVAELERSLNVTWVQPAFRGYGRSLTLGANLIQEETDAYDRTAAGISAGYDYRVTERLTLSAGAGYEFSQEDDGVIERDINIFNGLAGLAWDGADNVLDPTQGLRFYLQGEPSYTLGDTDGPFMRSTAEVRGYTGINADKFVLAGRFKIGSIFGAENADIPIDRRFFSGGGGSVRGYGYQTLGPRNDDDEVIGGRSLMEASLEARMRFKKRMGAVLFVDAGEAATNELPGFSELRAGAGLGFRYYTQFGPLRVDVAAPIDPRPDDDPVQLYISIGQAF